MWRRDQTGMRSSNWREVLRHASDLEGFGPGVLACMVGLMFTLLSGVVVINNIGPESAVAQGEVIGLKWELARSGPQESPDIRFIAADGRSYVFRGLARPENSFRSVTSIQVRYDPANPHRASEYTAGWEVLWGLMSGAVCLTSWGLILIVSAIRSSKRSFAASGHLTARVAHFADAHGFTYPEEEN